MSCKCSLRRSSSRCAVPAHADCSSHNCVDKDDICSVVFCAAADSVVDPVLHRVYPYLLCIAFGGIFALLGLRALLIIKWRLPFPSGTASGSMINSLHAAHDTAPALLPPAQAPAAGAGAAPAAHDAAQPTALPTDSLPLVDPAEDQHALPRSRALTSNTASPAQLAARKVKVLAYTALGSFLFDVFKW